MSEKLNLNSTYGIEYECNDCGKTTDVITPTDGWVERGIPTPDGPFDGVIGHFCPECNDR